MCGINGITWNNPETIAQMNHAIAHRGPDFAGTFFDGEISLGHLLLSIRDSAVHSHQPWSKPNSPWVLLFNGQIYNTDFLKRRYLPQVDQALELDTAILFNLIERVGWDFCKFVHGMYAIALYHKERKELRLFRDPSGQKPLYYWCDNSRLVFSSELKGVLASQVVPRNVEPRALQIAATCGYIPGRLTVIKDVFKLSPSTQLIWRVDTKSPEVSFFSAERTNYYADVPRDEILAAVVRDNVQSRYPVSVNLSGGLDSSLLVHEMSSIGCAINTYTTRFINADIGSNEDADVALATSRHYGTNHSEIEVGAEDYKQNFIEAYRLVEEPNYNISLPIYLLTAKREGVAGDQRRVVLSGDGGDEVFGGYAHYQANLRYDRLCSFFGEKLSNFLLNIKNGTNINYFNIPDRWYYFKAFRTHFLRESPPQREMLRYLAKDYSTYVKIYGERSDSMHQMMVFDRVNWLASENFIRSDKLFMSQSIELRSPLAYHPLRTTIDTLDGVTYFRGNTNKAWLRDYYDHRLPRAVLKKGKSGWRAPLLTWYDNSFRELFLSVLPELGTTTHALVDWGAVQRKLLESDAYPGKNIQLYLSLAILRRELGVEI